MAATKRVTFLTIDLKDQPGALLEVMQDLKSRNIALKALWGFSKRDMVAELCAIAKDPEKLRTAWRNSGRLVQEGTGFFLSGIDKTGILLKSLELLKQEGINMKAICALAVSGKYGTIIWVDSADVERAATVLAAK